MALIAIILILYIYLRTRQNHCPYTSVRFLQQIYTAVVKVGTFEESEVEPKKALRHWRLEAFAHFLSHTASIF